MNSLTQKFLDNYQSNHAEWEKFASIRSKPRRTILENEPGYYFSIQHQPLCIHPMIQELGDEVIDQILTYSLYKYLQDIANIEIDIINKVAYKITKNQYCLKFNSDMQKDALSIIIDESYHAYVALDFLEQVENKTGLLKIDTPSETALSRAIKQISSLLPEEEIDTFHFIATCIAEHALTNDLISVAKSNQISKTFFFVMQDHAQDEGRHAQYFRKMLEYFWQNLKEDQKDLVAPYIPMLINQYFDPYLQYSYDEKILKTLNISSMNIKKILDETHAGWSAQFINKENIIAKQMIALLKKTGVFDYPTVKEHFTRYQVN